MSPPLEPTSPTDPPGNQNIAFYLQVYHDLQDAVECLSSIRLHYPHAPIIVISDGDPDPMYEVICDSYGCLFHYGTRLYDVSNGGHMIQRMLDSYLNETSADTLIKVDTDTRVHRRLRFIPDDFAIYGTLEHKTYGCQTPLDPPNVQGGCMLIPRAVAVSLASSGVLKSDELLDYRRTYADNPDILERAERHDLISMDFVTRYACKELGIEPRSYDEVHSVFRGNIPCDGDGFAITHPHKKQRIQTPEDASP